MLNRTTLRFAFGVILPAVLVLVGATAAVVVSLNQMADRVNRTETALTRRSAEAAIQTTVRRMGETVGDYAQWDDAARGLYGQPDSAFVEDNYALSTANPVFFDTAYLVDGQGRNVFAFRLGEPTETPALAAFGPALTKMLAELPQETNAYDVRSGLVNGAWGLAIIAAAPVVPASEDLKVEADEPRYLVIGKAVDAKMIERLGEDYVIQKLALGEPVPLSDSRLGLTDFEGNSVAWLTWSPRQLGSQANASVTGLALLMLALLALTMTALVTIAVRGLVRLQRKESEASHAATHDGLTGLPNRVSLVRRLETAISAMRRGGTAVAVAYLDLDGFKEVNDTYGHEIGDALLKKVAAAFRRICGEHLLVRVGGDEFAVVIEKPNAAEIAVGIGERLVAYFSERLDIDGRIIPISTSVGIVVVDSTGISVDELLRRADVAMYQAKQLGRDRICTFDRSLDAQRLRRAAISAELRRALATGGLSLVYQPVFDARSDKVVSAEALLRWDRPDGQQISPAEFIPIAEETGLIDDLGMWTLRSACRDALAWPAIRVSVNASPAQFRNPDFASVVASILREVNFPAERLEIEVTENYFIAHPDQAKTVIDAVRSLGVVVALDDFGTGYSSIGYLRRFAFDKLKLDRSLVVDIDTNPRAQELVQATIYLARALDLTVTAEGVETEAEATILRAAGCHEFQGFLLGFPAKAGTITELLRSQGAAGARQFAKSA